ncbi:hypothetical protein HWV62_32224 [Athelia sp. TMB]|nr:hypothetical protein HWV62_32224 [Athelia sp. TMB]
MPKGSKHVCFDIVKNGLLSGSGKVCGKSFVRKGDLTRHRKIHTGIMDFKCSFCHKGFQQQSQLTNHENVHTGNTPHRCDICGEAFKDPSSCCRHRKEQHEGDYICFVSGCGKSVYRAGMDLEEYWKRRDVKISKRTTYGRKPVKRSESFDIESDCSLRVDNVTLYHIDSLSSSSIETPECESALLPQSIEDFEDSQQEWSLWFDWKAFGPSDAAMSRYPISTESSASPSSMPYSLDSSPLPFARPYPGYSNRLSIPSQIQARSNTLSPIPWFDSSTALAPSYTFSRDDSELFGTTVPISRSLRA